MDAKGQPLRFLCDEQILEIPFFQRAYIWNDKNWKELLDDLLLSSGRHFLGSIILKRIRQTTGSPMKAFIIDGQQRLTTLSILVKALYDCIDNKKNKLRNDAVEALFYTLRSSDSEYILSIKHSHKDRKQFEEVIGTVVDGEIKSSIQSSLDKINDDDPYLLIKRCYKFFYSQLKEKTQEEIINLWDSLFDKNNNILVVIDLDDNDQEQKIFDTINSSGIRLSSTDIIKNALYQKMIEITHDEETVATYYKKTWEYIFEKDDDAILYWSSLKSIGRLMRQNSELLLQAVAIIKGIFDVEKHTIHQMADLYKEEIINYDVNKLKALVEDIISYAQIYKDYILEFKEGEFFEFGNESLELVKLRLLHILEKNDISTFNPYIIYVAQKYKDNPDIIIKKFQELEKFVMCHLITKSSTKNFNKDCSFFINDKMGKTIENRIADFTENQLYDGISKSVSNNLGKVILFWIELKRRFDDSKFDTKLLQYNYQLEHILPQKWEKNWSSVLYVDEQGNILPDDMESRNLRYDKVYSLGNMTLLNGRLNSAISNNNFKIKMIGEGRKHGIIKYSSLSITKDDIVEKIYNNGVEWNEKAIIEREKNLGKEVVALWGFQS